MPVIIKPTSVIAVRLGIQEGGPAHKFLTNDCYNHMDKYVPYSGDTGRLHLRENVSLSADSIVYHMPHAHAQYVGYTTGPVVNYTTPGTGPYWDELMWSAEGEDVIQEVQEYIETHGGNNGV